ncbi:major pilin protein FimA [Micromonospora sp. NRRL B-16802]|nr:major pilin protein FimA [Micromonospora sp. NRRL B-16802]
MVTFSLVARSADGRLHGVVVASKFLAAGALVPAAEAEIGALATQAHVNLAYRPQGLALLRTGVAAADVVAGLVAADGDRAHRQLGVVGATGPGATWTGPACHPWAGGRVGDGWAAQGNILAGPEVVDALADAWLAGSALPFAERLVAALRAGDEAGGDRRGRQSAGLLVVERGGGYAGTSDVLVDLRVDDQPDPVAELERLLAVHTLLFSRPDPATLLDLSGAVADEVAALLAALGHQVAADGPEEALFSWAALENLEERLVPGRIDPVVLTHLRSVAPHVPAPRQAS